MNDRKSKSDDPTCAECGKPATHWTANGVMAVNWCTIHRHKGDTSPYRGRIKRSTKRRAK